MPTRQLNGRLWFRLFLVYLGIGAAIAILPIPTQTTTQTGAAHNPTIEQTSLEFILERKF